MCLQDGAATLSSLDKEGKPGPEAAAGVVRTIVEAKSAAASQRLAPPQWRGATPSGATSPPQRRREAFLQSSSSRLKLVSEPMGRLALAGMCS